MSPLPDGSVALPASPLPAPGGSMRASQPARLPVRPEVPAPAGPVVVAQHPPRPFSQLRRPRENNGRLSRSRVLDATAACLDELGYDQTTIRTIARRLDCAVGSIYRYSRDKRELLDAVVQRRFEPVAEAAEQGKPVDQTARLYLSTAAAQPEQYRLMLWLAAVRHPEPFQAPLPAVIDRILAAWSRQLGGIEQARRQWACVHSAILLGQNEPLKEAANTASHPIG